MAKVAWKAWRQRGTGWVLDMLRFLVSSPRAFLDARFVEGAGEARDLRRWRGLPLAFERVHRALGFVALVFEALPLGGQLLLVLAEFGDVGLQPQRLLFGVQLQIGQQPLQLAGEARSRVVGAALVGRRSGRRQLRQRAVQHGQAEQGGEQARQGGTFHHGFLCMEMGQVTGASRSLQCPPPPCRCVVGFVSALTQSCRMWEMDGVIGPQPVGFVPRG